MARYVTRVRTTRSGDDVFAYMADMRNFAEWDPGVESVEQIRGTGAGADSVFDVTIAGRRPLVLRYETVEYDAPRAVLLRAESKLLTSVDRITVAPEDDATLVTYDAELTFNGLLRVADLGLGLVFRRIGDRAAAGMREILDGEAVD